MQIINIKIIKHTFEEDTYMVSYDTKHTNFMAKNEKFSKRDIIELLEKFL